MQRIAHVGKVMADVSSDIKGLLLTIVMVLLCAGPARAMREVGGKGPVAEGPWPDGVLAVANQPARFAFSQGTCWGGALADTEFLYRGDTGSFAQALAAFAEVRAPALELVIHDAPHADPIAKSMADGYVDWTFTVWNPEGWHSTYNDPQAVFAADSPDFHQPVAPPRLDVYVASPLPPGGIDWTKVRVPEGIRVTDERAAVQKDKAVGGAMLRGVIYDMATGKTIAAARIEAQKRADPSPGPAVDKGPAGGTFSDQVNAAAARTWPTVAEGSTDAAGRFEIGKLPAGAYRLLVSAKGYAPRLLVPGADLTSTTLATLDGELSAAVTVKGTASDEQGKPLAGVRIRVKNVLGLDGRGYSLPQSLETTTDDAGRFAFTGMPTGYAQFSCSAEGFQQLNAGTLQKLASWKAITDGGRAVHLTGEVPVFLRLAVPGTIRCKVVSLDGKPLREGWDVTVADAEGGYYSPGLGTWRRSAPIQPDGTAVLTDVPPGRYFVVSGYRVDADPDPKIVTVSAGQTIEVIVPDR